MTAPTFTEQADADHRIACLEATLALVEAQIVSHGERLL